MSEFEGNQRKELDSGHGNALSELFKLPKKDLSLFLVVVGLFFNWRYSLQLREDITKIVKDTQAVSDYRIGEIEKILTKVVNDMDRVKEYMYRGGRK